jgi:competence protein ComEC
MKNKKIIFGILIVLFISVMVIWNDVFHFHKELKVVFFNVGQGDSVFIETSNKFQVVIDGGPDSTVLGKLSQQMPFYDKTIDLIILSHPDYDHVIGLIEILKRYEVENILWTGVAKDTGEWKEWEKAIKEEKSNIIIAKSGEKIVFQNDPLVYLEVFYPFESLNGQKFEDTNDTSMVGKIVSDDKTYLFVGDISQKIEKQLLEKESDLRSDVIKIAHHGSKTSSSLEFIKAVNPKTAVISVGENKWGHPAEEVLQRLRDFGIDVLITKELGDIEFNF